MILYARQIGLAAGTQVLRAHCIAAVQGTGAGNGGMCSKGKIKSFLAFRFWNAFMISILNVFQRKHRTSNLRRGHCETE